MNNESRWPTRMSVFVGTQRWTQRVTVSVVSAALLAPVTACGAGESPTPTSSDSASAESWREKVIPEEHSRSASAQMQTAMRLANEIFDEHEDVWALNHFGENGTVVVNLTAGWEEVLSDEVDQLTTSAPAPIQVREVRHSYTELMAPALIPSAHETDFAGATMVTAFVDPERNALKVGLTEVDEDSVLAAASVFGPNALFTMQEAPGPAISDSPDGAR